MPARCQTCGEEALTDSARFCVGCGTPLGQAAAPAGAVRETPVDAVTTPEPIAAPVPARGRGPRPRASAPAGGGDRAASMIPLSLVIGGVVAILALLLVLLVVA